MKEGIFKGLFAAFRVSFVCYVLSKILHQAMIICECNYLLPLGVIPAMYLHG